MAARPERWAVDAGTRDVARLDVPADALHEREFEIFCRAVVVERSGAAGAWHELSVRVNGALEWTRRVDRPAFRSARHQCSLRGLRNDFGL